MKKMMMMMIAKLVFFVASTSYCPLVTAWSTISSSTLSWMSSTLRFSKNDPPSLEQQEPQQREQQEPVSSSSLRPQARREVLQHAFASTTAALFLTASAQPPPALAADTYTMPDLPYAFDALEPFIDAPTMKLHHDKHHATYVANINKALEGKPALSLLDLQTNAIDAGPAVRNNGGGHYNHAFFWSELSPADTAKKTKPSAQLQTLIESSFGSVDAMTEAFSARAAPGALFGSGWVWLCVNAKGDALTIAGTPNQDNPLMKGSDAGEVMFPILGLDVWEHAYYLKYQNRRPEYVQNWWNLVNWDKVSENCAYVVGHHKGVPVEG